jgi:outer membrane protein TolC
MSTGDYAAPAHPVSRWSRSPKVRLYTLLPLAFLLGIIGGQAQDLQSYIREGEANNPDIQAYELRYDIAQEKVNEVNTLPNTIVSAGYFVSEPETRTGAQRARFSVSQMLPWFGTITARENYATSMAETEFVEIAIAKRKLALSVAQSYYKLYAVQAKQDVLDENIRLLRTYERLALTSVEVGKASAVDVLRLQIRQNELQQQKEVLQQEYLAEQASFNQLLNRKESIAVEVVPELRLPMEDPSYSADSLRLHPELLKYDRLYESVEQSELLNQKESAPDIGVGLDYVPVSERVDMNPSDNGKDILMPMLSLSIPIFNNRYSSVSKQNELRQREIEFQKSERLNTLETTLAEAKSHRNQARIKFSTQEKNLEQARDAEEILIKNYETGTIDFNDVLDIQELQLKFQTNQIESVRTYYTQSALINYLIN